VLTRHLLAPKISRLAFGSAFLSGGVSVGIDEHEFRVAVKQMRDISQQVEKSKVAEQGREVGDQVQALAGISNLRVLTDCASVSDYQEALDRGRVLSKQLDASFRQRRDQAPVIAGGGNLSRRRRELPRPYRRPSREMTL
jgi:hypothetical protein